MGHHQPNGSNNLRVAFLLNLGFTILEFIGGMLTNSVAILSDAVHDLGDSFSLGLAWYLDKKAQKGSNKVYTYGYARFSLLGALINSVVLLAGSIYVVNEAVNRIVHPEVSNANGMIIFGILGVFVNGYAAWKTSYGETLNEKVISWHLIEDVLGWLSILVVAIVLKFYPTPYLDPALSLLIAGYILFNVFKRLKETLIIFLQGIPKDIDLEKVELEILNIPQVKEVRHSHLWSLDGEKVVFTTHVHICSVNNFEELFLIKKQINQALKPFHFKHHTIEIDIEGDECSMGS